MEALVVAVALVAMVALVLSLIQTASLAFLAVHEAGIGRIIFLTLASLKLWCLLTLAYFLVNTLWPDWLPEETRLGIRLFLGVYLLAQPLVVNIALYRWRHKE